MVIQDASGHTPPLLQSFLEEREEQENEKEQEKEQERESLQLDRWRSRHCHKYAKGTSPLERSRARQLISSSTPTVGLVANLSE